MRRIFVSIPLPSDVKARLGYARDRIEPLLPNDIFRFGDPESWHITVAFLGDQDDDSVAQIAAILGSFAPNRSVGDIALDRVTYGPRINDFSLIWAVSDADSSRRLGALHAELEQELIDAGISFRPDNRKFTAHITLARAVRPPKTAPVIEEPLGFVVVPQSLDLMESFLEQGGARHELLTRCPLLG